MCTNNDSFWGEWIIYRTSILDQDIKPCDWPTIKQASYTWVDIWHVDNPDKLWLRSVGDTWYSEGENHRIVNGCIARDFNDGIRWVIPIRNGDELANFVNEYAPVIISRSKDGTMQIEIYDGYRE